MKLPTERSVNIAKRLKEMRRELGYTQTQLAKIVHTTSTSISNWENIDLPNEPTISQYEHIVEHYLKKQSTVLCKEQSVLINILKRLSFKQLIVLKNLVK